MNPELIKEFGSLINQFGFPIFFGVVAIFGVGFVGRYFMQALEIKDCNFLAYAEKRDSQITQIVESHNAAFEKNSVAIRENTLATHKLRESVESRIKGAKAQTRILEKTNEILSEN